MQTLQIVQFCADALQTAAVIVVVANLALLIGLVHHRLIPTLMHHTIAHHTGRVGDGKAVESIWENLVSHTVAKPVRCGALAVINRQLPTDHFRLGAAVAVFAQPDRRAVGAGKAESVPDQFRLGGRGKCTAEQTFALCGKVDLLSGESKFLPDQQRAAGKMLLHQGAQRERNFRAAGDSAERRFVAEVAGVKNMLLGHRGLLIG